MFCSMPTSFSMWIDPERRSAMFTALARRTLFLLLILIPTLSAAQIPAPKAKLTAERKAALDQISANSLRGNLSFIASDLLEGRGTPSRGLDLAAEYIAAQF